MVWKRDQKVRSGLDGTHSQWWTLCTWRTLSHTISFIHYVSTETHIKTDLLQALLCCCTILFFQKRVCFTSSIRSDPISCPRRTNWKRRASRWVLQAWMFQTPQTRFLIKNLVCSLCVILTLLMSFLFQMILPLLSNEKKLPQSIQCCIWFSLYTVL